MLIKGGGLGGALILGGWVGGWVGASNPSEPPTPPYQRSLACI